MTSSIEMLKKGLTIRDEKHFIRIDSGDVISLIAASESTIQVNGHSITLNKDGVMTVSGTQVKVTADKVDIEGNVTIKGQLSVSG